MLAHPHPSLGGLGHKAVLYLAQAPDLSTIKPIKLAMPAWLGLRFIVIQLGLIGLIGLISYNR
jgi:hypothetical protein